MLCDELVRSIELGAPAAVGLPSWRCVASRRGPWSLTLHARSAKQAPRPMTGLLLPAMGRSSTCTRGGGCAPRVTPCCATAWPRSSGGTSAQAPTQSDDDGDNTGLWGLLGLAGLAGLAGLKRRDRHDASYDREGRTTTSART
jgi:hypothetical protein